ncbi:MAG: hypothetical protein LAP40_17120 [Acidobacteriia bacterium]|nr:hypothetical protein [Terriglobia bacterium]
MKTRLFALIPCLVLGVSALWAHHSLTAEYDQSKKVTLHGTLTSIDWRNPHAWIYLSVKTESGATEKWQCELGSPNAMTRQGWTQDAAKPGDEMVVDGLLAKDGSKTCSSRNVKMKDGRVLWSQSQGPER